MTGIYYNSPLCWGLLSPFYRWRNQGQRDDWLVPDHKDRSSDARIWIQHLSDPKAQVLTCSPSGKGAGTDVDYKVPGPEEVLTQLLVSCLPVVEGQVCPSRWGLSILAWVWTIEIIIIIFIWWFLFFLLWLVYSVLSIFYCIAWWPSYTYMHTFFLLTLSCSIISD